MYKKRCYKPRQQLRKEPEQERKRHLHPTFNTMDSTTAIAEQGSQEWFAQRRYKYTSSCIWKLCGEPKNKADREAGNLSEAAKTYVMEKVAETFGGMIPDGGGAATTWGDEQEPIAAYWYEQVSGYKVETCGFQTVDEFYGGSPDRKVFIEREGEYIEGALEIKCPYNSRIHFEHSLIESMEYFKSNHADKYWQCISHMDTLNVGFCDFVSFDPRIDSSLGLFCFRLIRDESEIEFLRGRIAKANEYKNQLIAQFKGRIQ